MKKFIIVFLLSQVFIQAQVSKLPADTEFCYTMGGKNYDEGRCIRELPKGGYIIAGTSSSFGHGNTSVYLVKTDSMGKHTWSATYGGSLNDWGYSLQLTPDKGYFVAGYSNSFNPQQNYDPYYFKTDSAGNLQWEKHIPGNDWSFIYASAMMPGGGYILCGKTFVNSNGGSDGYLVRLNNSGDTLWTRRIGGVLDESFNSIAVVNNKLFVVGSNFSHRADSLSDGWVLKLDSSGNVLNTAYIAGPHHYSTIVHGITPSTTPFLYLCGEQSLTDSGSMISLVAKIDTSLIFPIAPVLSYNTARGNTVTFNQVINTSYQDICAIGTASGGLGGVNMFFVGYRSDLSFINDFAHDCGGRFDDYGYGIVRGKNGKLLGVGKTLSYCSELEDVFLVRFNSDSVLNTKITTTDTSCFRDTLALWLASVKNYTRSLETKLFPNPVQGSASLEIKGDPGNKPILVKIYSIVGAKQMELKLAKGPEVTPLDLNGLEPGAYILHLEEEGGSLLSTIKFIILK